VVEYGFVPLVTGGLNCTFEINTSPPIFIRQIPYRRNLGKKGHLTLISFKRVNILLYKYIKHII